MDGRKRIRKVVWTRIDRRVFDDNEILVWTGPQLMLIIHRGQAREDKGDREGIPHTHPVAIFKTTTPKGD